MTTIQLTNILKNYKENKSIIETTLARIEIYKEALRNPQKHDGVTNKTYIEPGMPKSNKISNPVEAEVLNRELNFKALKQWIQEDQSRVKPLIDEKEQLEMALGCLTELEYRIVKLKYFERYSWLEVEDAINEANSDRLITAEWLKKVNGRALNKLKGILSDFYKRRGYIYLN